MSSDYQQKLKFITDHVNLPQDTMLHADAKRFPFPIDQHSVANREVADLLLAAGYGQCLYTSGNAALLFESPRIAIVGSRQAGEESLATIEELVRNLVNMSKAIIVSGAALGTDMAAHRAALQHSGRTIAVLPSSLDRVPWTNWRPDFQRLAEYERTVFLSSFPPGTEVDRTTPVVRNRLIAALAQAVIVGETGSKSGTFHCVRHARALGVPIFFLDMNADGDPLLAATHRMMEAGGAVRFPLHHARDPRFADNIVHSASTFRKGESSKPKQDDLFS